MKKNTGPQKMNTLLGNKAGGILSVYFTAGYPRLNDTVRVIKELKKAGVDMIEIGMPFSDPLADGPTIQISSEIALKNGMNIDLLFRQLAELKSENKMDYPVMLMMGYFNPLLQYGVVKFCKKCSEAGISGTIIPDLPVEIYLGRYKRIFDRYGLKNIFLITPHTSKRRIKRIDDISDGFIYAVSSSSTTGGALHLKNNTIRYFRKLQSMRLKNPVLIGFGISDAHGFRTVNKYAQGGIIGTAFIKAISGSKNLSRSIADFIHKIR